MTAANDASMSVAQFEDHAARTDQLEFGEIGTSILGLVGEVGSLVSAVKKKRRDTDGFFGYRDAVVEELGDVLWYLSAVARRGGSSLVNLTRGLHHGPNFATFDNAVATQRTETLESALLGLAGGTGHLAKRKGAETKDTDVAALHNDLSYILGLLGEVARAAEVTLTEAAIRNVVKTEDRWPTQRVFPPLLDEGLHIDEQLPRQMRVLIYEREVNGTRFVFQKAGGFLLGDRLTDNHLPEDDFRFHDVFHLAYAAVLGWSPTTRALLKIKRKSQKALDENEDGARANLIEEGLTTWIFETAKQHRFFANTPKLGLDILKDVKRFVRGYEAEKLPMWLWESAILQGYAVFRQLQTARIGVVLTDLNRREIWFEDMTSEDRESCGMKD
ncbi:nucleoside triphosphate pyrophosphohydrolase family protein [Mesorhizobium sp. M0761]|uniref:nucleoside triphosphate pyrophosphohydrolase family protein n=1 Tax=unclassified Mesorhizobium TaxID=325217 RepID=UPI0004CE4E1E|nr:MULTISPECIES: nucleoside triphosphate pyrophosphohydrolase family protein [unclassified Mesorhizobium]WJI56371.1 nucleoside triphosphate pyrophosphohydrolase family protein [Mesorhizobium sp. C432A]